METPQFKLVVGLGNPERRYLSTRHNVGFMVLEELRRRLEFGNARTAFHARMWKGQLAGSAVVLMEPQTYMNRSGLAVSEAAAFYKLPPEAILVVMDDLALPVGRLRARLAGSAGGHNGLTDILAALGTQQVPRLRIGIGSPPPRMDQVDFVLSEFWAEEKPLLAESIAKAADAAADWAARGIEYVMNRYNQGGKDL